MTGEILQKHYSSVHRVFFVALLLFVFCLYGRSAFAAHLQHYADQHNHDAEANMKVTVPEMDWPGVGRVNQAHSYLSSTVEKLAQRIDTFFGEDRVYEEATGTYIQTRTSFIVDQDGELDYDLKFRAKLRLPQLRQKLRLVLESEDEDRGLDDFSQDTRRNTLKGELEKSDISASLQYMFQQTKRWNIKLRPGVKLSDSIESFIRLRMAGTQQLTEKWLTRGISQFGYYSEEGWRSEWRFDFERRTGSQDFFRTSSNVLWRENSPGNQFLSQTFLLTHILNPRTSVAFEVGVTGETRPKLEDTSYFSSVRYRRDIHRGWLFMELKPLVVFSRDNNFDEDVSLFLTLEILLGENYTD